jgi:hypothetical protein
MLHAQRTSSKYHCYSLWFHLTRSKTHDLPHSRWACQGFRPGQMKPKAITVVFAACPLSMQHSRVRVKTGWLKMRIMC